MPNNTNPQAIDFLDNKVRRYADLEVQLYLAAKELGMIYDGRNMSGGETPIIPLTDDPIGIDPANDKKPTVTGNLLIAVIYRANDLIESLEADNKARLASLLAVAPNP